MASGARDRCASGRSRRPDSFGICCDLDGSFLKLQSCSRFIFLINQEVVELCNELGAPYLIDNPKSLLTCYCFRIASSLLYSSKLLSENAPVEWHLVDKRQSH